MAGRPVLSDAEQRTVELIAKLGERRASPDRDDMECQRIAEALEQVPVRRRGVILNACLGLYLEDGRPETEPIAVMLVVMGADPDRAWQYRPPRPRVSEETTDARLAEVESR
ncbi:MAG TPA: hypothetical protein VK453_25465 [Micromonosporaceae bacterium]|nr:hypothetical protein [Micromonosporaceae bacterium]